MLDEFEFLVKEMQASDILFQQELQSKQSYCFSEVGEVKMLQFRFLANVEMPYSQLNPGQWGFLFFQSLPLRCLGKKYSGNICVMGG